MPAWSNGLDRSQALRSRLNQLAARRLRCMASVSAASGRKGLQGFFQCVVLGGLLVTTVIVGLLAMHTLNLHGTSAAHVPTVISAPDSGTGKAHHGTAGEYEPEHGVADPATSCADCGTSNHLGMALACVLALLLVLLVILPPRLVPGWMRVVPRPLLAWRYINKQLTRAPSLHVLCISRT